MAEDKEQGIKRVRIVASLVSAGMFATTAAGQFRGQPGSMVAMGILISTLIGFGAMWILITAVKYLLRLFRG